MPGTIQVSVLDFNGPSSSSPTSPIFLKVSMGKREYQTWDTGEFSFPLTALRDNLIITLQDAKGNQISHTGIGTTSIVEKGLWDDLFPLEGGGHVHLRLQFILSKEERDRIRIMRESAMKKKLGASTIGRYQSLSSITNEVSDSKTIAVHDLVVPAGDLAAQSSEGDKEGTTRAQTNETTPHRVTCETNDDLKRSEKKSRMLRTSKSESSGDDSSRGPIGQLIKIAIIVGFGILVFLTRQREPRKSKRKENDNFFTIPYIMDQESLADEE
ncbi:hypothetical protein LguiB_018570 [Lonicera macranthoides]